MHEINSILFATGQPVFPAGWGGAETTIHDLLVELARRGIQTHSIGAVPSGEASRVRDRIQTYFGEHGTDGRSAYSYDVGYSSTIVPAEHFEQAVEDRIE